LLDHAWGSKQNPMNAAPIIPVAADPFSLFRQWFAEAGAAEPMPEAVSLATATKAGRPSLRMVLLKDFGPEGLVFYTNGQSRKGREIAENPFGALCLYWKSLGRQIRAEGPLSPVSAEMADAYFAGRPRASQLGAWASDQSRVLPERAELVRRLSDAERRFEDKDVSRPEYWIGFRMMPDVLEFWHDVPNRLHDRLVYRRTGNGWTTERLYP
jgi:pyridoxamine 5'-phosphate oxidase